MQKITVVVCMLGAVVAAACTNEAERKEIESTAQLRPFEKDSSSFVGTVVTTTNAGRYVYLEVETKDIEGGRVWVATTSTNAAPGETVTVMYAILMMDFYSPTLQKTFEKIYFTGTVLKGDIATQPLPDHPSAAEGHGGGMGGFYMLDGTNSPHQADPHGTMEMPKDSVHGFHGAPAE